MYGKIIKVSNRDFDLKVKDREVVLFCCFKDLKYGNIYAIFSDKDNFNNTLYYGSIHFKENSIVIIDTKKDISNMINDLILVLNKNKKLYDYQILDIKKYNKIELISNNEMKVDNNLLNKLEYICVKKPAPKKKKQNKDSAGTLKSVLALLFVLLFIYIYVYLENKDNYILECSKDYEIKELSKVNADVVIYFNKKDEIIYIDNMVKYIFDTKVEYQDFKTNNQKQNKYIKDADGLKYFDSDNTLMSIKRETNVTNTFKEIKELYTSDGYKCEKRKINEK